MILKPALAAMLVSGLIVPETPKLVFPKPAIVKRENFEFMRQHMLLGMPLTMGMLARQRVVPTTSVVFQQFGSSTSALTTYSFTNVNIGTAASNRHVVVIVAGDSGNSSLLRTVSSVSIAGTTGTLIGDNPAGTRYAKSQAIRAVTTGTTATISVTFSGSMVNAVIGVFATYGLTSTTIRDEEYSLTVGGSSVNMVVGDVTAPEIGDILIIQGASVGDRTFTFTGGTPVPTNHGTSGLVGSSVELSAASSVLTSTSQQSITLTFNSGATGHIMGVILRGST